MQLRLAWPRRVECARLVLDLSGVTRRNRAARARALGAGAEGRPMIRESGDVRLKLHPSRRRRVDANHGLLEVARELVSSNASPSRHRRRGKRLDEPILILPILDDGRQETDEIAVLDRFGAPEIAERSWQENTKARGPIHIRSSW